MELSRFIRGLTTEGKVHIHHLVIPFSREDLKTSRQQIKVIYQQDRLGMPYQAPRLIEEAAIWGAAFMYRAIQFVMLRETPSSEIDKHLQPYLQPIDAHIAYSVDLILRYLPEVFNLAKGLAPEDPLVNRLYQTGLLFPYSVVGVELKEEPDYQVIFGNVSLKYALIDRIIEKKSVSHIKHPEILNLVQEVLGQYSSRIWPELSNYINHT